VRRVSPIFCIFHADLDVFLADRVLYSPERLLAIATEAAKPNSAFSLDDRIGLVHDAMALAKAGHLRASAALALINTWCGEEEHLVWKGIAENLGILRETWWEDERVLEGTNKFRRVRRLV
jgi:aminopeptidase 2